MEFWKSILNELFPRGKKDPSKKWLARDDEGPTFDGLSETSREPLRTEQWRIQREREDNSDDDDNSDNNQ